ncbi:MAG: inositol monophosphatase family protein [Spirochaetes bacterium]|nr:inositol monophosphatase family protein [Spirochaetota bacterium]
MKSAQDFFLSLLPQATEISKEVSRRFFKKPLESIGMISKADASPVTAADLEIEAKLRELIEKNFPDHGIIGEEHGNTRTDAEFVWVLDPIDGTKSFITGVPLFTTLISLMHNGEPQCGAIYQPILDELVWGNNKECFFNGSPTRMREKSAHADATLLITDARHMAELHPKADFTDLTKEVKFWRTWADGYGYALLATGYADIMLDPVMNPWDIMAVVPVIRGAGGVATDFAGGDPVKGKSLIAATKTLHASSLKKLFP